MENIVWMSIIIDTNGGLNRQNLVENNFLDFQSIIFKEGYSLFNQLIRFGINSFDQYPAQFKIGHLEHLSSLSLYPQSNIGYYLFIFLTNPGLKRINLQEFKRINRHYPYWILINNLKWFVSVEPAGGSYISMDIMDIFKTQVWLVIEKYRSRNRRINPGLSRDIHWSNTGYEYDSYYDK